MRSRYCAYVRGDAAYLWRTWHASTRPALEALESGTGPEWCGLTVVASNVDEDGRQGYVEFNARYRVEGRLGGMHETSRFLFEDGQWFYVDGVMHPGDTAQTPAGVSRNSPCPCGSGKKFKRCCGR